MKPLKLNYHSDAAHGWVAVKRALLEKLGILNKITPFSYQKGGTVYLEGDQDLDTFIEAVKATGCCSFEFVNKYHEYSPIRSYESFRI